MPVLSAQLVDRPQVSLTVEVLERVIHEHCGGLGRHGASVADLAFDLAATLGLSRTACDEVRQAAILHDLGKLAIPDEILQKPGALDPAEWHLMRRHPEIGAHILGTGPGLAPIGELVRASHEKWDGTGYPSGLAGREIPLGARIVSLCDAYDAMVTTRSYRARLSHVGAVCELRRCAGTQFDPALVEPFIRQLEGRRSQLQLALAA